MKVVIEYDQNRPEFIVTEMKKKEKVVKKYPFFQEVLTEIDRFFDVSYYGNQLIKATREHKLSKIKELLSIGVDIESKDYYGKTALIWAAAGGYLEIVKFLHKEKNAKLDQVDNLGFNGLMFAAEQGEIDIVKYMVKNGVDIESKTLDTNMTALMFASKAGQYDMVKYLISLGVKLDQESKTDIPSKKTALIFAAENNQWDIVKLLLENGASINAWNEKKHTTLMLAGLARREDLVRYMIKYSENVYLKNFKFDEKNSLIEICKKGDLEAAKIVLSGGISVEARDPIGKTPLIWSAASGNLLLVKYLVEEMKADINSKDVLGFNSLMFASEKGYIEIVKYLIAKGIDVNSATEDKNITPLMFAAREGHNDIVEYLIFENSEIDKVAKITENSKHTALIFAAERKNWETVRLLVERGANITARDGYHRTAIMFAARDNRWDMVDFLILYGANINETDIWNASLVIYAAKEGDLQALKSLYERNANIKFKDMYGWTAKDYAIKNGHDEIVNRLERYMEMQFWH